MSPFSLLQHNLNVHSLRLRYGKSDHCNLITLSLHQIESIFIVSSVPIAHIVFFTLIFGFQSNIRSIFFYVSCSPYTFHTHRTLNTFSSLSNTHTSFMHIFVYLLQTIYCIYVILSREGKEKEEKMRVEHGRYGYFLFLYTFCLFKIDSNLIAMCHSILTSFVRSFYYYHYFIEGLGGGGRRWKCKRNDKLSNLV